MGRNAVFTGKAHALMIHGIQGTSASWRAVAASSRADVALTLPDLRGRGEAFRGRGPEDYTLVAYANDLQGAIDDSVGAAPFFLIGWSMGVSVILEYLRREGVAKPQGLIMLSGSPVLSQAPWFTHDGERLMKDIVERERRLGLRQAADHQAVAWTWEAIRSTDQRPGLAAIETPALIIHGSEDQDSPLSHAHWMVEGMPHAALHVIEGAGHMLLSDHTEEVARKIDDFIDMHRNHRITP